MTDDEYLAEQADLAANGDCPEEAKRLQRIRIAYREQAEMIKRLEDDVKALKGKS